MGDVTTGAFTLASTAATAAAKSTDGKTVTLTFADAEHTNATFTVAPISTKADITKQTAAYTAVYTYTDKVAPAIKKVTSSTSGSTANKVKVEFTEGVKALAVIKIDGVNVGTTTPDGASSIELTLGTAIDATKEHTLEVVGLKDLSDQTDGPNVAALLSAKFTPSVDAAKPVATVSAKNDKAILITFNKTMSTSATTTVASIDVVDAGTVTTVAGTLAVVADTDSKQWTFTLTNNPYSSTVTSKDYIVRIKADIQDSLGNKTDAANLSVTLKKDTTAPVATGVTGVVNSDGKYTGIKVTFNENIASLTANATTVSAIPTIVNGDGQLVAFSAFSGTTNNLTTPATIKDNTLTYPLTTPVAISGTYTFTFGGEILSDASFSANKNATFTFNYNFGAAAAATGTFDIGTVTSTTSSSTNVITVIFPEAVVGGAVANSATDAANYSLNGAALPAGTTITLNSTSTQATITLPGDSIKSDDNNAIIIISGIKAKGGKTAVTKTTTVAIIDTTKPVLVSARLLSSTQIELTYDSSVTISTVAGTTVASILNTTDSGATATEYTVSSAAAVTGFDKKIIITGSFNTAKTYSVTTKGAGVKDTSATQNAQKTDTVVTASN